MELGKELTPPRAPFINVDALPKGRLRQAAAFAHNVSSLSQHAEDFAVSVVLFGTCSNECRAGKGELFCKWIFVGARQAIVSAYNYQMALDGCKRMRRTIPEWSDLMDNAAVERAWENFRATFPNMKELRQTVLHTSEIYWNEERVRENSVGESQAFGHARAEVGLMGGNVRDSTYIAGFGGKEYEIALTSISVMTLNAITSDVFSAICQIPTYGAR